MNLNTNIQIKGLDLSRLCSWLGRKCLNSADELTVTITCNDRLLDRAGADDLELKAMTVKSKIPHIYTVILRSGLGRMNAMMYLCHEFIHIGQMESGRFVCDYEKNYYSWEGVQYDASMKYEMRPWEIDAFRNDDKLFREYRKLTRGT